MKKIILAFLLLVSIFQSKSQDTTITYVDRLVAMNPSQIHEYIVSVATTKDTPNTNTLEDSIKLVMVFDVSDKNKFKEIQFKLEGYENFPPRINQIYCTWIISEEGGTYTQAYTIKADGTNWEKVLSYGLKNSSNKSSFKVCVLLELTGENGFVKDITECKRIYYSNLY